MENRCSLSQVGNYQVTHRPLGKGTFAKVYEAKHRQLETRVALKVVNLRDMDDRYMRTWYRREAQLLSQLSHSGVVSLFEVMESSSRFFMVLELADTNLCDFVRSNSRGRLDEPLARNFARQMIAAVAYIHSQQIIHRDLKLENVLLNVKSLKVKLSDFGLSKRWDRINPLTTNCGSPEYAAPELHANKPYDTKVDVWALGVVFFGMLVGRLPFEVNTKKPVSSEVQRKLFLDETNAGIKTMKHQTFMGSASFLIKNLLGKMLEPLPSRRWSIGQVAQHSWIKSFRDVGNSAFAPLDEEIKGKIIEKCFAGHKMSIMEIREQLDERPHGPIGGMFNIEKFLYQSTEANKRAIKVSQSHLNKLISGTEPADIISQKPKKDDGGRPTTAVTSTARGRQPSSQTPIKPSTANRGSAIIRTERTLTNDRFGKNFSKFV